MVLVTLGPLPIWPALRPEHMLPQQSHVEIRPLTDQLQRPARIERFGVLRDGIEREQIERQERAAGWTGQ